MPRISPFILSLIFSLFSLGTWAKGPVSHICKSTTIVSLADDGEALIAAASLVIPDEDCCPSGTVEYGVREMGGGSYEPNIELTCSNLGQTFVQVRSTDCLGNNQTCETVIIVQANIGNCDAPCPSCCFPVLVTEPMSLAISEFEGATINASQFAGESYSPCGQNLTFSFSDDPDDNTLSFSCDDLGQNVIEVWTTDDNGVQNFVQVILNLQDVQGACSSGACLTKARLRSNLTVEVQYDSSPTCIKASDFDLGSGLSACISTTSFTLSFTADPADTERCFSCIDVGQNTVEIFVIDNLGTVNSVEVQVIVQANAGQCSSVIPFAPNDDVCDAINLNNIFGEECGVTFVNIDATAEPDEIAPQNGSCTSQNTWCDNGAEHSVWFSFTAPAANSVTISTSGFMDTQLALWDAGDCAAILDGIATLVVANDDIPNTSIGNSIIYADCLTTGKTYFLQVDGKQGQQGGFDLTLVAEGAPCLVPAPIASSLNCGVTDIGSVTSTGAGEWLYLTDANGNLVASVNDMGQNLGEINADLQINGGNVRTDDNGVYYLDRNWQIVPTEQPDGPVLVRLYFEPEELDELVAASPIVNGIGDLNGTKVTDGECGDYSGMPGDLLVPKNVFEQNESVLTCEFEVDGFSAFYLHGPMGLTNSGDPGPEIEFAIYPNPTSQDLLFTIPPKMQIEGMSVQILGVNGQLVLPEREFDAQPISIAELSSGVYFVKIKKGNTEMGKRFVKMNN